MPESTPRISAPALRLTTELDHAWRIDVSFVVDPPVVEELWDAYRHSFETLRTKAAQRHVMTRHEFDEVMADRRVDKIVIRPREGAGGPACLSCVSRSLDAVPLISSDYYRARWPQEYDEGRVWYVSFIAVATEYQGSSVMGAMIHYLVQQAGREGGVLAADFCEYNEAVVGISSALTRLARNFNPGTRRIRLDSQQYWGFEIPRADR